MEENKNVQTATEPSKDSKKKNTKKDNKKKGNFIAEHKAELKKVTWPTKNELVKETVTVIIVSLLVGVIIFGMDTLLSLGYNGFDSLSNPTSTKNTTDVSDLIQIDDSNADIEAEIVEDTDADAEADIAEDTDAEAEVITEVEDEVSVTDVVE